MRIPDLLVRFYVDSHGLEVAAKRLARADYELWRALQDDIRDAEAVDEPVDGHLSSPAGKTKDHA